MNTFLRFFYEFISIFFEALFSIGKGIYAGILGMFNIKAYGKIINEYKASFAGKEWIFVGLSIAVLVIILLAVIILLVLLIKKIISIIRGRVNQDSLLNEIAKLNAQVKKLMQEKDKIMAMKVSQLGLKPGEEDKIEEKLGEDVNKDGEELDENGEKKTNSVSRFPKLTKIDERLANVKVKNYNNSFTLEELMDNFRCFAATQLHLYYNPDLLRPFFAGLACGKLVILQGISGTGKTSLAYAWGKFTKRDSCIASVQPSWRDKTEFVGYFNEFTKKFNETPALAELYTAGFDDDVHTIILDEMNIARVEYYFAEMLSVLEVPNRKEWIIELVTSGWPDDPKKILNGKLTIPPNLWYIGTINNDDSTFAVTDKVYDRAMPIDINSKVEPFKCREQMAIDINASYLDSLFMAAPNEHPLSDECMAKISKMDDYVITHFRVAFGNRIMKQLKTFTPVYVSCGGKEVEAVDYFIAKKIFRKFEQLNLALIRDEINPFISFLNKEFGKGAMKECIEYLERIKKSI